MSGTKYRALWILDIIILHYGAYNNYDNDCMFCPISFRFTLRFTVEWS